MGNTLYGDAFMTLKFDHVDRGEPEKMHAIFDLAIENGAKPLKISHPLNKFDRVLNALERDERFEKTYIEYLGIYTRRVRVFQLKEVK